MNIYKSNVINFLSENHYLEPCNAYIATTEGSYNRLLKYGNLINLILLRIITSSYILMQQFNQLQDVIKQPLLHAIIMLLRQ